MEIKDGKPITDLYDICLQPVPEFWDDDSIVRNVPKLWSFPDLKGGPRGLNQRISTGYRMLATF
jgi:hypothetical protein